MTRLLPSRITMCVLTSALIVVINPGCSAPSVSEPEQQSCTLDTAFTASHDSTFFGLDLERLHDFHVLTSEDERLILIDGEEYDISTPMRSVVYVTHRGAGDVRFFDEPVSNLGNEFNYQSFPKDVPLDGSPLQFSIVDPAWFDTDTMRVSFASVSGPTRIRRPAFRDTLSRSAPMRIEWDPGTGKEYVQIVMQQNVDIAIVDTTFHGRSCYTHDDGVFEICHDDLQSLPTGYYDLTLTRGHAASGMSPIPTPWLGTAKSSHTITVYLR